MSRKAARTDALFTALADPTRRAVVQSLSRRPWRAGELAEHLGVSAPALSRHLRQLKASALIVDEGIADDARVRVYKLAPQALKPLHDWLDDAQQLWERQLAAFKAFAERSER